MLKSLYWRFVLSAKARKSRGLRKRLGHNIRAIITESENGIFAVDPEDLEVGEKLRKGGFGLDEIERLGKYLNAESKVLIVGSHIGSLAIPLAKKCAKLVAVEANPDTFELLKLNISLNDCNNIKAHNIAASDKREQLKFLKSRVNSGGSKRTPKNHNFMYDYDKPEEIEVEAYSLDEHLGVESYDLVIMDIEGSEYFALKGMAETLVQSKVLVVEFLPHHLRDVAGITVDEFLSVIPDGFVKMTIPSQNRSVDKASFEAELKAMFAADKGDDGLIFEKV
jgi:FkbM family methyltransferase